MKTKNSLKGLSKLELLELLADQEHEIQELEHQLEEKDKIINQELICKGWFLPPNTYDCGSFVVN